MMLNTLFINIANSIINIIDHSFVEKVLTLTQK